MKKTYLAASVMGMRAVNFQAGADATALGSSGDAPTIQVAIFNAVTMAQVNPMVSFFCNDPKIANGLNYPFRQRGGATGGVRPACCVSFNGPVRQFPQACG